MQLGKVKVGGDAPITVQSMTKTDTRDVRATVQQIWIVEAAGCEIVRCAVPVREAAEQLGEIKKRIRIPLVADIHFNYKLALIAIEQGVDGLRLNPGNIGARKYVEEVVQRRLRAQDSDSHRRQRRFAGKRFAAKIRWTDRRRHGRKRPAPYSYSRRCRLSRNQDFAQSLRSADDDRSLSHARRARSIIRSILASPKRARRRSARSNPRSVWAPCSPKASATRFAFRWPPTRWKKCASVEKSSNRSRLKKEGLTFVACPSCGRADVDLVGLAKTVEERMPPYSNLDIHVAVMGCEVNGPGEARAADLGVAGGKGIGLIFKRGEMIRKVPEAEIVDALMEEVEKFAAEKNWNERRRRTADCSLPFPNQLDIARRRRGRGTRRKFLSPMALRPTSFYPKPSRLLWRFVVNTDFIDEAQR